MKRVIFATLLAVSTGANANMFEEANCSLAKEYHEVLSRFDQVDENTLELAAIDLLSMSQAEERSFKWEAVQAVFPKAVFLLGEIRQKPSLGMGHFKTLVQEQCTQE